MRGSESAGRIQGELSDKRLDREKAFGDQYAVLIERNIFSRNRPVRYVRPGEAQRERPEGRPIAPPPEENLLFTGVVLREETYTAFIENIKTGSTVRAKVGDAIARGKISGITLDHLTYELEGKSMALEIGKTLAGGAPGPSRSSGGKSSPGEKAAEAAGSGPSSDVLERMRQRRLQEMKK